MRLVLVANCGDGYTFSYTEYLPIIWESKESAEFEILRILELKAQYKKDMKKYLKEKVKHLPPKQSNALEQKEYDELYSAWLKKKLECPKDTVMFFGSEMCFSDLYEDMKILTLDEWYHDAN